MSYSVWPHRRQPTRLSHPWDSPGNNTGVGCHFLLQCMKVKSQSEVAQSCLTLSNPMDWSLPDSSIHGIFQARVLQSYPILQPHGLQLARLLWPCDSPHKNTGVGCRAFLQGTEPSSPTSNQHWRVGSLSLEPPRKPNNWSRHLKFYLISHLNSMSPSKHSDL